MKNSMKIFIAFLMISFLFNGCTGSLNVLPTNVIGLNYSAADELIRKANLAEDSRVIVTTIVDINHIEDTNTLGLTISEHLTSEFVANNMKVIEMKLRNNVYMKVGTGELMLSRDISKLAEGVKSEAIVVGTYSNTTNIVYVNLKLINPKTNIILSTLDYKISKDNKVRYMLGEREPW